MSTDLHQQSTVSLDYLIGFNLQNTYRCASIWSLSFVGLSHVVSDILLLHCFDLVNCVICCTFTIWSKKTTIWLINLGLETCFNCQLHTRSSLSINPPKNEKPCLDIKCCGLSFTPPSLLTLCHKTIRFKGVPKCRVFSWPYCTWCNVFLKEFKIYFVT